MAHWYLTKFKNFFHSLIIVLLLIGLAASCLSFNVYYQLYVKNLNFNNTKKINNIKNIHKDFVVNNNDNSDGEGYLLEVLPGEKFNSVLNRLKEEQVISSISSYGLYFLSRFLGYDKQIKIGEYVISNKITPIELIHKLIAGEVVLHRFSIIEGWRFEQLLYALNSNPLINHNIKQEYTCIDILNSIDRTFSLNIDEKSTNGNSHSLLECEGLFMADTYLFAKNTKDLVILQKSYDAMQNHLNYLWQNSKQNVLKSPYEALVMASIIEKETSLIEEMPRVSGVYHRRLSKGIPLQADPTVIYGSKIFDRPLTRKDLKLYSKYNTYTNKGLPPAPIAIPGYYSIVAALNPMQEEYLYFVADGSGGHVFSTTFMEHLQAIARIKSYSKKAN